MDKATALEVLEDQYAERLLRLSTMVSDNRISATNARIVFKHIRSWHDRLKQIMEKIYE